MAKKAKGEGSVRQLPDGSWECVIQSKYLNPKTNTAKRIKRKGKNAKEATKNAKLALKVWEKQFEAGVVVKIDKKKTFGQYMEEFIEKEVKTNLAGSSYKSYIYAMQANFYNYKISKLQLHNLNKIEFEIYFDTLIHDKSYRTAEVPIQLCKRCCTWLYGESLIEEDYASFARIKTEKKDENFREKEIIKREQKEIFTNEDIIKFYDSYKNNVSEYSAAVILLLETMMRGQELLPLTLDDIDLEKNIIYIRSAVSERFVDNDKEKGLEKYIKVPKNRKERIVYMTPLAREVVEYMITQTRLKCRHNPDNLLYTSFNKHGKMRSMDAFEIQFKALCDKIGVDRDVRVKRMPDGSVRKKGLNVHALRHTAITLANTAHDANVINTALMAGHTAIRTENIYTHANEAIKNVKTASELVLGMNETQETMCEEDNNKQIDEDELYEMYLKLQERFGGMQLS